MDTLQPNIAAAILITYLFALVAFALRVYVRMSNGASFIAGDWISTAAMVGFNGPTKHAVH
jgi:hypothetical protein